MARNKVPFLSFFPFFHTPPSITMGFRVFFPFILKRNPIYDIIMLFSKFFYLLTFFINVYLLIINFCNQIQEALVLLLDVGPTMHSVIPEIEKVCSMLVQKKVYYYSYMLFLGHLVFAFCSLRAATIT